MKQRRLPFPRRRRLPPPADAPPAPAEVRPRRGRAAAPARPRAASRPSAAPTALAAADVPPLVLATADPSLMRMLTFALEQHRLPYTAYTSGTAVLDALLSMPRGGVPAVVLLDVDLPGVDGHAILERLGVERPDASLIVVLSSHADESVQVRSLLAGALDHLAKPFNVRVLMAKLRRWTAIARRCEAA